MSNTAFYRALAISLIVIGLALMVIPTDVDRTPDSDPTYNHTRTPAHEDNVSMVIEPLEYCGGTEKQPTKRIIVYEDGTSETVWTTEEPCGGYDFDWPPS